VTAAAPLLDVRDLVVRFPVKGGGILRRTVGHVRAVDGVSLQVGAGETLGLVGESGCGKSTVARAILQLVRPSSGSVRFHGQDLTQLSAADLRPLRQDLQIVFQDPDSSLDPRMTVNDIVAEPLRIHGRWKHLDGPDRVAGLLRRVGLEPEHGNRYPHEFSGGQCQRIGIARALALEPRLLVLDEPVSALDVSVQAGVVNLLKDLQDALGLSYLFIAHDLEVVRHVSDRVAVMYHGRVVETGPRQLVLDAPGHPYTRALLAAALTADLDAEPDTDPDAEANRAAEGRAPAVVPAPAAGPAALAGRAAVPAPVPAPAGDAGGAPDSSSGCAFRSRCPEARPVCAEVRPELTDRGGGHLVACISEPPPAPTVDLAQARR
jgi:ABC-type oligopeptide transport system ATPase subunit